MFAHITLPFLRLMLTATLYWERLDSSQFTRTIGSLGSAAARRESILRRPGLIEEVRSEGPHLLRGGRGDQRRRVRPWAPLRSLILLVRLFFSSLLFFCFLVPTGEREDLEDFELTELFELLDDSDPEDLTPAALRREPGEFLRSAFFFRALAHSWSSCEATLGWL